MKPGLAVLGACLLLEAGAWAQVPPPPGPPGQPAPAPTPPGAPAPGTPPYTPPSDPTPQKPKPPKDKRKRVPDVKTPAESGVHDGERNPYDL